MKRLRGESTFPDMYQQKVIEYRGPRLVVVAGPGTGKTQTLVERARRILANDPTSCVSFVTFTRSSRRDTRRKLEEALGPGTREAEEFPRVSTLHGFAKSIVHKAPRVVSLHRGFCVLVPDRELQLVVNEVIEDLSLRSSGADLQGAFAKQRNTGILAPPEGMNLAEFQTAIEQYEKLCRFYNATDIEGLVTAAEEIVRSGTIPVPKVYLHVDEYQDLNPADQKLIEAVLSAGPHEIVVVGDDDQSIYGRLRDARPEGIRELFTSHQWEKVPLRKSHRLPTHILRMAQALIQKHRGPRLDKGLEIPQDDGKRVSMSLCTTDEIEAELVASRIREEQQRRKKNGQALSYSHFLVVCPTRRISNTFATRLQDKWNVPVRKIAPRSIPDDLWRIVLILRMAGDDDNLALRQWLNLLQVPQDQIRQMRHTALARNETLFQLAGRSAGRALRSFLRELNGVRGVRGSMPRLLERAKFLAGVSSLPFEVETTSVPSLITRLYEEYGLYEIEEPDTKTDEVLVTTLHSSKGLEAEVVFVVQLSKRYIPNPSRDWDEELRVLYVAMTRAKQELYLSCPYTYDPQKGYKQPSMSPFLELIKSSLSLQKVSRSR